MTEAVEQGKKNDKEYMTKIAKGIAEKLSEKLGKGVVELLITDMESPYDRRGPIETFTETKLKPN